MTCAIHVLLNYYLSTHFLETNLQQVQQCSTQCLFRSQARSASAILLSPTSAAWFRSRNPLLVFLSVPGRPGSSSALSPSSLRLPNPSLTSPEVTSSNALHHTATSPQLFADTVALTTSLLLLTLPFLLATRDLWIILHTVYPNLSATSTCSILFRLHLSSKTHRHRLVY